MPINILELKKYLLFGLIIWLAHFLNFQQFGLYYDDHNHLVPALNYSFPSLVEHIGNLVVHFPEGRPLHEILISVFAYFGSDGGLATIYFLAYLLIFVNTILFYRFLKIIYPHELFCLLGTLSYCLYPADTNRVWLTHTFGIESAVTFFLIASICYLSGQKLISYLLITASLLTYETFLLIFMIIPLLETKSRNQKYAAIFGKHIFILTSIFLLFFIIRILLGDSRASSLELSTIVAMLSNNLLAGPIMSLSVYWYRPLEAIQSLDFSSLMILILAFILCVLLLFPLSFSSNSKASYSDSISLDKKILLTVKSEINKHIRLIIFGCLLLVFAYLLSLRETIIWGKVINGKPSRIHFAAIVGNSIIFSTSLSLIWLQVKKITTKKIILLSFSFYFALLIYFGDLVQLDFIKSWSLQRAIFTDIVRLCPDMNLETLILVDANFDIPKYADPIEEVTKDILKRIYKFPDQHPKAYVLRADWKNKVEIIDDKLIILNNSTVGIHSGDEKRQFELNNVIYLEADQGYLTRIDHKVNILNHGIDFKPISSDYNYWKKSRQFDIYIDQEWLIKPPKYI